YKSCIDVGSKTVMAGHIMLLKLSTALGKDTSSIKKDIAEKSKAAIEKFYDHEKGVFVSGEKRQISLASNIWMCLAGVFDEEQNAQILERTEKSEGVLELVTPYAYHYYVQALINCGKRDKSREIINGYWGAMADDGADTFYEMFDPENPDFSAYGAKAANSYCHAWSCTPSYFFRKYFTENDNG
ncbi:MAG: sugar hydrolase, partial [Clostridiales bacterium]|nr:sugar hydrolase [Clostridiales bacterium]